MMGVVLASLVLLIVPIFVSLSVLQRDALASLEWILWLVFAAEFGTRWYIAMDRSGFVKHNLIDLAVAHLVRHKVRHLHGGPMANRLRIADEGV